MEKHKLKLFKKLYFNRQSHTEKEYKFLIDFIPKNLEKPHFFEQTYIHFEKNLTQLKQIFNIKNLKKIKIARIRRDEFDGNIKYTLTLKSNELFKRDEYETEISNNLADSLLKNKISCLQKNRYIVAKFDFKFEFDEYLGDLSPLKTVEVEVSTTDNTNYTKIVNILENVFKLKIKDVTMDERYKNNNLSKGSLENETNKQFKWILLC